MTARSAEPMLPLHFKDRKQNILSGLDSDKNKFPYSSRQLCHDFSDQFLSLTSNKVPPRLAAPGHCWFSSGSGGARTAINRHGRHHRWLSAYDCHKATALHEVTSNTAAKLQAIGISVRRKQHKRPPPNKFYPSNKQILIFFSVLGLVWFRFLILIS